MTHEMEARVRALEDAYLLLNADLKGHLAACEKRAGRLERLAWATGAVVLATLGLLLKAYFHIGF